MTRQSKTRTDTTGPSPVRQNVPTELACPKCGGQVLIMTVRGSGRRFLACRNYYSDLNCDYTSNRLPESIRLREAGFPTLPGLE